MLEWPIPKSVKSLRRFLALTGYYKKFIRGYDSIVVPFTMLLKKSSFIWSKEAEVAFNELKRAVTQPLVLRLPDFSKNVTIECDAFGVGLGGILMQEGQPITFYSKALKGRSLLLSTYDKELLALVSVVARWRPYLLGQTFKLKIDKNALKHLLEQKVANES